MDCFNTIECQASGRFQQFTHHIDPLRGPRDYLVSEFASTPGELDTLAAAAGLHLAAHWSDWQRRRQVGAPSHISLYRLP